MVWIEYTHTTSDGRPAQKRLKDPPMDESVEFNDSCTANVTEAVATYLIERSNHPVRRTSERERESESDESADDETEDSEMTDTEFFAAVPDDDSDDDENDENSAESDSDDDGDEN